MFILLLLVILSPTLSEGLVAYSIVAKTSSATDSGTASPVLLEITGSRGIASTSLSSLSIGSSKSFAPLLGDVGTISKITLSNPSTDGWRPEYLTLSNYGNNVRFDYDLTAFAQTNLTLSVYTILVRIASDTNAETSGDVTLAMTDGAGTKSLTLSGLTTRSKTFEFKRGYQFSSPVGSIQLSTASTDEVKIDYVVVSNGQFSSTFRHGAWLDSGSGAVGPSSATISAPSTFMLGSGTLDTSIKDLQTTNHTLAISRLPANYNNIGLVQIYTNIKHTSSGSLVISVTSPAGVTVVLSNRRGSSLDNIFSGTYWADGATPTVVTYSFTNNVAVNALRGETNVEALLTGSPNGNWVLSIKDEVVGDSGSLVEWAVIFLPKIATVDTFDASTFALHADAQFVSGDLQLTPNQGNKCGRGLFKTDLPFNTLGFQQDFFVFISIYIDQPSSNSADGMIFGVLAPGAASSGTCPEGGFFGLQGITQSVAVKFDHYYNSADDLTALDHYSVLVGGNLKEDNFKNAAGGSLLGSQWNFWIRYNGGTNGFDVRGLSGSLIRPENADIAKSVDLAAQLGSTSFTPFFSAATGGEYSRHRVLQMDITQECNPNPCLNGGTCNDANICTCASGFTGLFCQLNLDECASSPCENGGSCIDQLGGFSCLCSGTGYTGSTCQTDVNECTSGTHNCVAPANCSNTVGSFTCVCPSGYFYFLACQDYDECSGENGGHNCSPQGTCTNTPGGFSCACNAGYFGSGVSCTACGCAAGATGGSCNSSGVCTCKTGFTGDKCDSCLPNRFGSSCQECPACQNGICLSGIQGNGSCSCNAGWALDPNLLCTVCAPDRFGSNCDGVCPSCNQGTCLAGLTGNGTCVCEIGWQNSGVSSYCDQCAPGYALSAGQCKECHPTCKTCSGIEEGQCLSCTGLLIFNGTHCGSSCASGEYSNGTNCIGCDSSCEECIQGGPSACSACETEKVFDKGYCLDDCLTPQTYNNSGTCEACHSTCATCQSGDSNGCLSCVSGLLLSEGACFSTCPDPHQFGVNGFCTDCHATCATCNGTSPTSCLSCSGNRGMYQGECLSPCPDLFFNENNICKACDPSCLACSGGAFFDCIDCKPGIYPFLSEGVCLSRCPNSKYAPPGSHICADCPCNGHSQTCLDDGACFYCQGNTEGDRCQTCKSGFFRLSSDLSEPCVACSCNGHSSECDKGTGVCSACSGNTQGENCEECRPGFMRLSGNPADPCEPCECNGNSDSCDVNTGACENCGGNSVGDHCQLCPVGFTLIREPPSPCEACSCHGHSGTCHNETGICTNCGSHTAGNQCEQCQPGFTRLSTNASLPCMACECNGYSNTCDYITGVCSLCQNNTMGDQCETCSLGFFRNSSDLAVPCQLCSCSGHSQLCDQMSGVCSFCGENTAGARCEKCAPGFMRPSLNESLPCEACECNGHSNRCEEDTGVCLGCGDNTQGDSCQLCARGAYRPQNNATLPCLACKCNERTDVCDSLTGVCSQCSGNFTGDHCELCPEGLVNNGTYCVEAGKTLPAFAVPVISVVVVIFILIIIALILLFIVYKRSSKRKLKKQVEYAIGMSSVSIADFERFSVYDNQSVRSSITQSTATMMNTVVDGGEVSIPGYLKMDYYQDLRIEKSLTTGGGGEIHFGVIVNSDIRAKYPTFADSVAIKKVLATPELDKEKALEQFHQEVAVMNFLSFHPNVIRLIGFTEEPNCIVTPLYQGDLAALIQNPSNNYNSLDVADIALNMLAAIDGLHTSRVAHRDIKPKNFLLEPRKIGEQDKRSVGRWSRFPFRVRICDFGVCYVDSDVNTLLKFHNLFGLSAKYAAPEVFVRFNEGGMKPTLEDYQLADMYSFGVTLWEVIHRADPWPEMPMEELKERLFGEERPPIFVKGGGDVKLRFLLDLIQACWSQVPNTRPSAKTVISHLRTMMEEEELPRTETPLPVSENPQRR